MIDWSLFAQAIIASVFFLNKPIQKVMEREKWEMLRMMPPPTRQEGYIPMQVCDLGQIERNHNL